MSPWAVGYYVIRTIAAGLIVGMPFGCAVGLLWRQRHNNNSPAIDPCSVTKLLAGAQKLPGRPTSNVASTASYMSHRTRRTYTPTKAISVDSGGLGSHESFISCQMFSRAPGGLQTLLWEEFHTIIIISLVCTTSRETFL